MTFIGMPIHKLFGINFRLRLLIYLVVCVLVLFRKESQWDSSDREQLNRPTLKTKTQD